MWGPIGAAYEQRAIHICGWPSFLPNDGLRNFGDLVLFLRSLASAHQMYDKPQDSRWHQHDGREDDQVDHYVGKSFAQIHQATQRVAYGDEGILSILYPWLW